MSPLSTPSLPVGRRRVLAVVSTCLGVAASSALLATPSASAAAESGASRAQTVRDWNAIAVRTIAAENGQQPPPAQLHLGLVSSAVWDALTDAVPGQDSVRAAVAQAAHDVLVASFPSSSGNLHADLAATLSSVPDGDAEDNGVAVGKAAAQRLLASRDPLPLSITFTPDPTPEPGDWQPTPPNFPAMAFPWLGFVDPLLLPSPTSIDVGSFDPVGSAEYATDLEEVKRVGRAGSTDPAASVANGVFWNTNIPVMYNAGIRDWAARTDLGARATARAFALVNMTATDAVISCWRQKYDQPFWRPISAIRETAPSPEHADATWTPAIATTGAQFTPPYPEWPSGHGCLTGAYARSLTRLTGSDAIDLRLTNTAVGATRHYTSAAAWTNDAFISRIQLGIHFRDAMEDGYAMGRIAADQGFAAFAH